MRPVCSAPTRVRADEATIARSLHGNWRDEHLFALQQALERFDFLNAQIDTCQQKIKHALDATPTLNDDINPNTTASRNPHQRILQRALHRTLGVDLTAIPCIGVETALSIAAEIGPNLERFPSCEHFCSWLNLAPNTRVSGQRNLPARNNSKVNRLGQALQFVAVHATRSQSLIGASHRARLRRLDKPRAIKATAHQLARLLYAMLTKGQQYVERGIDQFEQNTRQRKI